MKKYITASFFLITITLSGCENHSEKKGYQTLIAFGSCSHQDDKLQMWEEIRSQNPDILILTGDNIYADTYDMDAMKAKYKIQKTNASYKKLIEQVPTIGVWDDHDYGINDGGKYYRKKDESKTLLLDFLDVPKDNAVRSHRGVYNVYNYKNGELKVILLDTRYFRDTLQADTIGPAKYLPNETGDILGKEQWTWLENLLTDSKADIHIIVSSIQLIPNEHNFEKWANFPKARKRFFDLITKTKPKGTIIISGDRHIAELSKIDLPGRNQPLYEITASGFTHTWNDPWPEINSHRIDNLIIKKNYGLIYINWSTTDPEISVEIKGHGDSTFLAKKLQL